MYLSNCGITEDVERLYNLTHGHPLLLELVSLGTTVEAEEFIKDEIAKRLSDDERNALELASVFRFPFYPGALLAEDLGYETIDKLVGKSLLQRARTVYDLHGVLRVFFYNRLPLSKKNHYHLRAAEYYEK